MWVRSENHACAHPGGRPSLTRGGRSAVTPRGVEVSLAPRQALLLHLPHPPLRPGRLCAVPAARLRSSAARVRAAAWRGTPGGGRRRCGLLRRRNLEPESTAVHTPASADSEDRRGQPPDAGAPFRIPGRRRGRRRAIGVAAACTASLLAAPGPVSCKGRGRPPSSNSEGPAATARPIAESRSRSDGAPACRAVSAPRPARPPAVAGGAGA